MIKPFPVTCRNCIYSSPEKSGGWLLQCTNPIVNATDSYFLGATVAVGSSCVEERKQYSPFAKCGIKGKLWEPK